MALNSWNLINLEQMDSIAIVDYRDITLTLEWVDEL